MLRFRGNERDLFKGQEITFHIHLFKKTVSETRVQQAFPFIGEFQNYDFPDIQIIGKQLLVAADQLAGGNIVIDGQRNVQQSIQLECGKFQPVIGKFTHML
jgi:hypothetical protein